MVPTGISSMAKVRLKCLMLARKTLFGLHAGLRACLRLLDKLISSCAGYRVYICVGRHHVFIEGQLLVVDSDGFLYHAVAANEQYVEVGHPMLFEGSHMRFERHRNLKFILANILGTSEGVFQPPKPVTVRVRDSRYATGIRYLTQ